MHSRSDLHDYQLRAVDFIKKRKRCMLLLDMGLGKTVSTLTAVSDLMDGCAVDRVLVIAPLRVANSVWPQEPSRWEHLQHLTVSAVTGSERQRMAALQRNADIYTINRENVPWLVSHYRKWPFDCVVIDESSSFKNASAKRFKALKRILPDTEYMVLLTGTPSPNGLMDLWSQMYLVDFGQSLGRTLTGYRQRFFEQSGYMGHTWEIRKESPSVIHGLISDRCLSMRAADYLSLPERIDMVEHVTLPPRALAAYRDFEKALFAELDSGEEIEAVSAAALAGKLLQWCNGAVYTDDNGNWGEVHTAKLDALQELREQNSGETMLVAYNFQSDLARLRARFPDAVQLDNDPETIERWNRGEIPMLLAHPACAGHGLNLQQGGSLCVWFGLNWSLELYQQFNARLHRQGQTKPVRIVHLVADGCIDERVVKVLSDKDAVQSDLLNALKQLHPVSEYTSIRTDRSDPSVMRDGDIP